MSKYDPLSEFLKTQTTVQVPMTFAEIERVLGSKLPASAYKHPAWWANDEGKSHVQAQAWLSSGFETEQVNPKAKKLVFQRRKKKVSGMSEVERRYQPPDQAKESRRHPAFGAMKGTFTIEPGYDLTQPAMPAEEWAEIEQEMVAKFDRLLGK
ncbi:MAG: hypothetical protein HY243_11855 [Proteobacteria bacterium]|nr:hypothetical protein [Pseudomonadota bacterium]